MSQTSTGPGARDKWDTPEVKLGNGKKGRLRKDRYSSLVIANMLARQSRLELAAPEYNVIGGDRTKIVKQEGDMYKGPDWFIKSVNDDFYTGIYR